MPKDALQSADTSISLDNLAPQTPARIICVEDDLQQQRRLMELGLPVGSIIHITLNKGRAGLIVARNESRLALGQSVARTIQVQTV